MKERVSKRKKIAFFGHFDSTNFGNESTLQAILYHLRRFQPDAEVTCICTGPEATVATHHVEALPIVEKFAKSWVPQNPVARLLRKICVGLPTEPYRWAKGVLRLQDTDALIIPGTGLLTDAYGLLNWGPYNLLKWSLIAKICRCKLLFVSVGAGPIYGTLGRSFIRSALSLADYRSYRDSSSSQCLKAIGFRVDNDLIYPDLAFSLPEALIRHRDSRESRRRVVGLGVMGHAGRYSIDGPVDTIYSTYLESLSKLVTWLLAREYDVRLLSGEIGDTRSRQELRDLLKESLSVRDEKRIIDEPICFVEDLLSQIATTDIVVATRFHNVLLALFCNKPVISISFHHKCESLMSEMGLSRYCLDINGLKADRLIEKFCDVEKNENAIKDLIKKKVGQFREALDQQYAYIFNNT